MALTKVTRSGITDNSVNAAKIEDGTIVDADITPGTITVAKLASTLDLSSKTVTLPNTSVTNGQLAGSIANAKLANNSITINSTAVALGGSISAGKLDWQSVVVSDGSTVTTMVAGRGYFINNSSAAGIVKLPASGTAGDTIAIKDYAGNFATNKLTIQRNGHNIQGVANNGQIATNRASVVLVYVDATKGWLYTNESNVADLQQALHISATGGTVLTTGDFKVHVFTGDGNFVVANTGNKPSVPTGGPNSVDYLVVAGGGQGSVSGGGGGGYRTSYPSPSSCAGALAVTAQTYPITVGAGGGGKGSDSIFSTITSTGGGRGRHYVHPDGIGEPGGSGSGGARAPGNASGGNGNDPPVSPPQGNNGGPSGPSSQITGGGGGGAGQGGATGPGTGGNGAPIADAFFGPQAPTYGTPGPGSGRYFSGGGGGSLHQPGESNKSGGAGGGGTGHPGQNDPGPATGGTNTGGGAGGATQAGGSAGGKGLVVIRYKFQN